MPDDSGKKSVKRDWLKAIVITLCAAAVIAGVVMGLQSLGIY